ncbi:CHAT domain-containing protein [Streptomyces erythrochromogenes]|uniref:CHAT domain-containing protein n=1 Tax=Streptomyces erythrochromogenes TaxID=285574 RepID=A0ABZ1Q7X1_9ACTN|nr:CHAT domain-containing protein [Streptomyces erythrochromogenes]
MKNLPFQLEIIEADTNWIVSCASEYGEALIRVAAPYSEGELQSALASVQESLARSYSPVVRGASVSERPVREFGERLTEAVFREDIFLLFDRWRSRARAQEHPLRILLRTNGPNLSHIPWEFLVDPTRDDYLALRVPVVRYLRLMDPVPPLPLTLPLRVLGISAQPHDLPALEGKREGEQISRALLQECSSESVDVHWLVGDRWQDLAKELRFGSWHVLHCVSHGGFDEERNAGYIQLSGSDGLSKKIYASDFERLIADSPNLRLIVLNSCESAVGGSEDVFAGTAANLVRAGVPAVVAMQYEITDKAALVFASSFYERIAQGVPVDRAVTLAREYVKVEQESLEWATPVLFLASDETRLFSLPKAAQGPPAQATPPTPQGPDRPQVPGSEAPRPPPAPPPLRTPSPRLSQRALLAEIGPCSDLVLGPGDLLAAACDDGAVRVLNAADGALYRQCPPVQRENPVRVAWGPWRRNVASRHHDGTVVVWDLQTEAPARVMNVGEEGDALTFSADGHWLAVTVKDRVYVYNTWGARVRDLPARPGKESRTWQRMGGRSRIGPLAFAPGDRHVVVATGDGLVRQLDVQGHQVAAWRHPVPVSCLGLTANGLATGCGDGRVRLWSWDGRLLRQTEHRRQASHLVFSAGASALAVCDGDGSVSLWDLRTGQLSLVAELVHQVVGLAFLENGRCLMTCTRAGRIERWSLPHRS